LANFLVDYQDYRQKQTNMTRIDNPSHPGEALRENVLPSRRPTVTRAAE